MDRRTFIGSVAGGLLAAPFVARGKKPEMPVIGFLSGQSPGPWSPYVAAFRNGLNETGYVEGKNVAIEYRWAEGQYGRLPAHQLVPKASVIAMIMNPVNTFAEPRARKVQEAARSFALQLHVLRARGRTAQEIDAAFATLAQLRAGALLVDSDPFFDARRDQFVALAARYAVPAMYDGREYVVAGGLMSYGGSIAEIYRQAGIYTGKILNGAKPADLPVLQPAKVELVINLKTAKALGLTMPQSLLLRADEVIQ